MLLRVVKRNALHAIDRFQPFGHGLRLVIGHVDKHDLCRAKRDKFILHQMQALVRLRVLRQIRRKLVLHLYPVPRKRGKHQPNGDNQKDQIPLVYNKAGKLIHEALFVVFRFLTHDSHSCV